MSTLKKLAEGTSYISAGQVADMGVGLLVTFLLVRLLSVADYGIYVLVLSVATVFSSFSDLGTASLIISKLPGARTDADRKALLRSYRIFVLAVSLAATAALALLADPIAAALGFPAAGALLRIAAIAAFFQALLTATQATLLAFTRFKQTFHVTLGLEISRLALIVLLVAGLNLGLPGAVLAYSASFAVAVLLGLLPTRAATRTLDPRGAAKASFRRLLRTEGTFAAGSHALKQLRTNAILWLIAVLAGPAYVAYYAIAMSILSAFTIPLSAFEQTLYPVIATALARGKRHASLLFAKAVKYGFLLSIVPVVLFVLLALPLISLVFTAQYTFSAFFYRVLALNILITGVAVAVRPLLFALSKQRDIFTANALQFIALLLLVVALLPLDPRLLTTGVVLADLVGIAALFATLRTSRISFRLRSLFVQDALDREIQARLMAKLRSVLRL